MGHNYTDNVDKVWEKLKKKDKDLVLFGLTDDGYEKLYQYGRDKKLYKHSG